MVVRNCAGCGRAISTALAVCPHCRHPQENVALKWIVGILAGAGLGAIVLFLAFWFRQPR